MNIYVTLITFHIQRKKTIRNFVYFIQNWSKVVVDAQYTILCVCAVYVSVERTIRARFVVGFVAGRAADAIDDITSLVMKPFCVETDDSTVFSVYLYVFVFIFICTRFRVY